MAALSERARRLMRPSLAGLEPYDPGFTPTRVILSANENDYGMPADEKQVWDMWKGNARVQR